MNNITMQHDVKKLELFFWIAGFTTLWLAAHQGSELLSALGWGYLMLFSVAAAFVDWKHGNGFFGALSQCFWLFTGLYVLVWAIT